MGADHKPARHILQSVFHKEIAVPAPVEGLIGAALMYVALSGGEELLRALNLDPTGRFIGAALDDITPVVAVPVAVAAKERIPQVTTAVKNKVSQATNTTNSVLTKLNELASNKGPKPPSAPAIASSY
jgi:hypothetical protein